MESPKMTKRLLVLFSLLFLFTPPTAIANTSMFPASKTVTVVTDDNIDLEVVDWGGEGTPLIFLAGLSMNAHTFDYLAPTFTDKYHVLGITRAGHGNSQARKNNFSIARQAKDIVNVLDRLNISTAIFAGHSFAGAELNYLARYFTNRVTGLIYIDALQDLTYMASHAAVCPDIGYANIDSFEHKEHFYETQRVQGPEGSYLPFADLNTLGELLKAEQKQGRDYRGSTIPAIAVSHIPEQSQDFFRPYGVNDVSQTCIEEMNKLTYLGIAKFISQRKNADVAAIQKSQHMIHMATPKKLKEIMDTWLEKTFSSSSD